jgi:protein-tyrosine phosphatase
VIDLHSHVLPGVDDGAADLGEALEICRLSVADGVTDLVATPHLRHASYWNEDAAGLEAAFLTLREVIEDEGLDLRLHLGGEIAMCDASVEELLGPRNGLFTLAGGKWVLLEFDFSGYGPDPVETVWETVMHGFRPIVAHPERLRWMASDAGLMSALARHGATFQLTAMSLTGEFGKIARDAAHALADKGHVHFVSSDVHDPRQRRPGLKAARELVSRTWGDDSARKLFVDHPRLVLDDLPLAPRV